MDILLGWLTKMDWTAIGASAITFIVGLAFIKPKLSKAMSVIGDVADLLSCLKASLADEKIDATEMKAIINEAQELLAEFKK